MRNDIGSCSLLECQILQLCQPLQRHLTGSAPLLARPQHDQHEDTAAPRGGRLYRCDEHGRVLSELGIATDKAGMPVDADGRQVERFGYRRVQAGCCKKATPITPHPHRCRSLCPSPFSTRVNSSRNERQGASTDAVRHVTAATVAVTGAGEGRCPPHCHPCQWRHVNALQSRLVQSSDCASHSCLTASRRSVIIHSPLMSTTSHNPPAIDKSLNGVVLKRMRLGELP